jgi:hypothetical protein
LEGLRKRLPLVYRAIRREAPNATLIVSGYPRLFPADPGPLPAGNCAAGETISEAEARYLNDKSLRLDQVIADAAEESGAVFVNVYDAFEGDELRCPKGRYLNPVRATRQNIVESFHPTKAGYERLAAVIARQLRATPEQAPAVATD